jgi:sugar lactone lactonase YvrE
VDSAGNVFVADTSHNRLRQVDITGRITTAAGNGESGPPVDGQPASQVNLSAPAGVAWDSEGNLYVADTDNNRVLRKDISGRVTTVAGNGVAGYSGDGGFATAASLNAPRGMAVDSSGYLYIAERFHHVIRRVDTKTGRIVTVAGTGVFGGGGDGQPATSASLSYPSGVAIDAAGNLYIADTEDHKIRKVDAETGRMSTVAGNGDIGYDGDDRLATAASLSYPYGVAVDADGNLFIADFFNNRVRRVDARTRMITTVAGNGKAGVSGDGLRATAARLHSPFGVAVDAAGNLYISDRENNRIRRVDGGTERITTVAGGAEGGYSGDGRDATAAKLSLPFGVALDSAGNLYIADENNNAIRAVKGPLSGVPGSPQISTASYGVAAQRLKLVGLGFGVTGAAVVVNGTDVTSRIRRQTDKRLVLRGSAEQFGLRQGNNEIVVRVGGRSSNVFVLTL